MTISKSIVVLLSLGLHLFASGQQINHDNSARNCFGEGNPRAKHTTVSDVIKGFDSFSTKFFVDVVSRNPSFNIFASPYSIAAVLTLAYMGANGSTRKQIGDALGLVDAFDAYNNFNLLANDLSRLDGIDMHQLNQAYFDKKFNLRQCMHDKIFDVVLLDFANRKESARVINKAVNDTTRGKIEKFLGPNDLRGAVFVLINAVYFKGTWEYKFDPTLTQLKSTFYQKDGVTPLLTPKSKVPETVTMMRMPSTVNVKYYRNDVVEVVELPYAGRSGKRSPVGMLIILPTPGISIDEFIVDATGNTPRHLLTSDSLNEIVSKMVVRIVDVSIPKFKMTTRMAREVKSTLANLGVTKLFDTSADLSLFAPGQLFVDHALHHATVEVNEDGTVAAAATALVGTRSGANQLLVFRANRPFMFLIRDNTSGLTLFSGIFRVPSQLDKE